MSEFRFKTSLVGVFYTYFIMSILYECRETFQIIPVFASETPALNIPKLAMYNAPLGPKTASIGRSNPSSPEIDPGNSEGYLAKS